MSFIKISKLSIIPISSCIHDSIDGFIMTYRYISDFLFVFELTSGTFSDNLYVEYAEGSRSKTLILWAAYMDKDAMILVAEDDDGHFALIERNFHRSGISNSIIRFRDGQQVLDYLEDAKSPQSDNYGRALLLLLDIRMPKVDGLEVLRRMKADSSLRIIPTIVLTTTGDQKAVEQCQQLGCSMYVVKPVEYEKFVGAIQKICRFLSILEVPVLSV